MTAVIPVLNKTYVDSSLMAVPLSTTTRMVFETKEFVIQAGKTFSITVQYPYSPITGAGSGFTGTYNGASIQVNDVWYDMGNGGYTVGMALGKMRPERYYDTKQLDLMDTNIVPNDASYRITVRLRCRMYAGTGVINAPRALINNGDGNRGIEIQEIMAQNHACVIIQEKDPWS